VHNDSQFRKGKTKQEQARHEVPNDGYSIECQCEVNPDYDQEISITQINHGRSPV